MKIHNISDIAVLRISNATKFLSGKFILNFFLTFALLQLFVVIEAQQLNPNNLVPNYSFEHGDSGKPDDLGQINRCDDWKEINSPDWYRETSGHFYSNIADPHSGSAFAGFSKSEGIQVKLADPIGGQVSGINEHSMVTIGFWFSPESNNDMEINLYLRTGQYFENGNEPDVNMDNILHLTIPVQSSGLNPQHIPGQWYHYQMPPVLVTSNAEADWLVIIGNPPGDTYVFIDDIEIYEFHPCWHTCVEDDGLMTIQTTVDSYLYEEQLGENAGGISFTHDNNDDVINIAFGNNYADAFFMLIKNAVRVYFYVWDSNNQPIWIEDSYDYNNLHDEIDGVVYDDFALVWNGEMIGGGFLPSDTYYYLIKVWQCQGPTIEITSDLIHEIQDPPAIPGFGNRTTELIDHCCEDHYLIQNTQYSALDDNSWQRYDADDFITAGENVDNGQPSGPVTVLAGSKVAYYAGNAINLEVGFSASVGSSFKAGIFPCGAAPRSSDFSKMRTIKRKAKATSGNVSDASLLVSPQPSTTEVVIASSGIIKTIRIYSSTGGLVFSQSVNAESINVNLVDFHAGLYLIVAETSQGSKSSTLIKQ